jgi:hypothetical protein
MFYFCFEFKISGKKHVHFYFLCLGTGFLVNVKPFWLMILIHFVFLLDKWCHYLKCTRRKKKLKRIWKQFVSSFVFEIKKRFANLFRNNLLGITCPSLPSCWPVLGFSLSFSFIETVNVSTWRLAIVVLVISTRRIWSFSFILFR